MSHDRTSTLRPAMQAGRFYEADPATLREMVAAMIGCAEPPALAGPPLALVAPHAGHVYSGGVAGTAYRTIQGLAYDHVAILAPSHFTDVAGAAVPPHAAFATPLGEVPLDRPALDWLAAREGFVVDAEAHAMEHSIEVHLPFLQVALPGGFKLVPLTLGRPPAGGPEPLVEALDRLLTTRAGQGERWLIVASSDTYHGDDPRACAANDARLAELIEALDPEALLAATRRREVMACGALPMVVAMDLARRRGAVAGRVLMRSDSGKGRGRVGDYVVGYVAAAFT